MFTRRRLRVGLPGQPPGGLTPGLPQVSRLLSSPFGRVSLTPVFPLPLALTSNFPLSFSLLLSLFFFPSSLLPSSDLPVIIFFLAQPTLSLPILPQSISSTSSLPLSTLLPLRSQPNRQVSPSPLSVVFHCFPLVMPISHIPLLQSCPLPPFLSMLFVRHRLRGLVGVLLLGGSGGNKSPYHHTYWGNAAG